MALTRWWENQRRFAFGDWRVMKVRKRANVRERITIMAGLSQKSAERQKIALEKAHEPGISYIIEQTEV